MGPVMKINLCKKVGRFMKKYAAASLVILLLLVCAACSNLHINEVEIFGHTVPEDVTEITFSR